MRVEARRNQDQVGRERLDRGEDALLERLPECGAPSPGESGALKMLPAPVSDGAPVPGKSGIWCVEA